MTSINQPANITPTNSYSMGAGTSRGEESQSSTPGLVDVVGMPHIAESILPSLTLRQATVLAGSSKEMRQIMNAAFSNTLPEIKAALRGASPDVRNYFMPFKLGSQGLLASINNRINAQIPGIHPALNSQAANRLVQINQNPPAAARQSPLAHHVHNPQ